MLARGPALCSLAPAPTCLYLLYSGYQRRRLQLARRSDKARPSSLAAARLPPRARLSSAEIQGPDPKPSLTPNKRFSFHFECRGCGRKDCGVDAVGWLGSARPRLPAAASPAVGTRPRNAPAVRARAPLHGGWDGPFGKAHARLSFLPAWGFAPWSPPWFNAPLCTVPRGASGCTLFSTPRWASQLCLDIPVLIHRVPPSRRKVGGRNRSGKRPAFPAHLPPVSHRTTWNQFPCPLLAHVRTVD